MWKIVYLFIIIALLYVANRHFDAEDSRTAQEKQVCEMVTKIIKDNYSGSTSVCEKASLEDKLSPGFNRGEAYLTNGNKVSFGVMVEGDRIRVVLNPNG